MFLVGKESRARFGPWNREWKERPNPLFILVQWECDNINTHEKPTLDRIAIPIPIFIPNSWQETDG